MIWILRIFQYALVRWRAFQQHVSKKTHKRRRSVCIWKVNFWFYQLIDVVADFIFRGERTNLYWLDTHQMGGCPQKHQDRGRRSRRHPSWMVPERTTGKSHRDRLIHVVVVRWHLTWSFRILLKDCSSIGWSLHSVLDEVLWRLAKYSQWRLYRLLSEIWHRDEKEIGLACDLGQSGATLWQYPDKPAITRLGTEFEDDV